MELILSRKRLGVLCLYLLLTVMMTFNVLAHPQLESFGFTRNEVADLNDTLLDPGWDVTVTPHWLPGSTAFWYRRNTGLSSSEFIFVDVSQGTRQAAFDHQKLAESLRTKTSKDVIATSLPFSWIDLSADGLVVRFRVGEAKWEFRSDGTLERYDGTLNEEKLRNLRRALPPLSSTESTSITFINHTKNPLSLYWVDDEGNDVSYGTVDVDKPFQRHTYVGHVWKLTEQTSGKIIGVYRATNNDSLAIFDDSTASDLARDGDSTIPKAKPLGSKRPDEEAEEEVEAAPSQAKYTAFVRDNNVWVREEGGKETKISTNGSRDHPYGRTIRPSPDGRFASVWQYTPAQDHAVNMVESSPKGQVQPKLKTIQYLKPGDRVRMDRPRMFDLEGRKEVSTDDELFKNPWSVDHVGWSEDGSEYRFLFNERGHQNLRIIGINRTGAVRAIVDESSNTFIDYSSKLYWRAIKGTDELLWQSERDNHNHLYLYDTKTATVKTQVTKGEWNVRAVVKVDEKQRRIWFRVFGIFPEQDPYYAHLARVNFDGTGLTILTEGDGTHTWKWSPDEKHIIDTWSRVDSPSQTVVRDAETGKLAAGVETRNVKAVEELAVANVPERFATPGRDGKTMIYGIIIKPAKFDPAKTYPVVEQIYAGPQDFFTPKAHSDLARQRVLADLGFVVVQVDGMGTNWRSKAFHNVAYKNLRDAGFPDRKAWMRAAARTRPWMDLERIGVYGGSAGGQNAMAALLWHGDFYKAAAADSGCHDNRMDKVWWNEQWFGTLDASYEDSSNVVHAKLLTGALMLIVGELDTNVDPASTYQVVNALNKAGKDYDLLVVPGGEHGAGSSPYGQRRQRDFFQKHLQGIDHPDRNKAG